MKLLAQYQGNKLSKVRGSSGSLEGCPVEPLQRLNSALLGLGACAPVLASYTQAGVSPLVATERSVPPVADLQRQAAKYMASQCVGASVSGLCLQDDVLATIHDWLADPATAHNTTVLLVAGLIFTNEEDYVEALKALHGGESLEM